MSKFKFTRKTILILIILSVLLISSSYLGLGKYTLGPLAQGQNQLMAFAAHGFDSLADFFSFYLNKKDLAGENAKLRRQLVALSRKNAALNDLRAENEWLKRELEFVGEYDYTSVIARVIGRSINFDSSDIVINQGGNQGLKPGFPVTTDQGVIIGVITKAEPALAYVRLLTDNETRISALIAAQASAVLGLASGQHNINLNVSMLPKDEELKEGDLVSSAGLDQLIPPGLLIGRVSKVYKREESLWQTVSVEPAVDYNSVRLVTVIISD